MYVVVAQWLAKEGHDDEIAAVLKTAVMNSRAEPGCVLFMANRSVENPRKFVLYEQFTDEAAFQVHLATESFKTNVAGKILPLLESRAREICSLIEPTP
jgi:(4S)-4-hydroxy-5-phosphonooxypentane-2,3-dione isomerase